MARGALRIWSAQATNADCQIVGQLLHDFNTEYDDQTPGTAVLAERLAAMIKNGDTEVLLVDDLATRRTSGLCVMRFRQAIWSAASECYLAELYIVPECRGNGIGRALLRASMDLARERGADYMDLGSGDDDVAARALYESEGFSNSEGKPGGPVNYYYERDLTDPKD